MLKKIIQLLSKDKSYVSKISDSKEATQSLTSVKKPLDTAAELKKAGDQHLGANNLEQAELHYKQSLEININQPGAYNNLAIVLSNLNRLDEALTSYDRAVAINPDFAMAYNNRGGVLSKLNRLDEALTSYDRAVAINPDYAEAYNNRGGVLGKLKRLDEALTSYDRAIELNPDFAMAYNNRGAILTSLNRLDEAITSYDHAITLSPDYAEAYCNRGAILTNLNRLDEALTSYDRVIALNPDFAMAYNNRGAILTNLNRLDEALTSYDRAIALSPDYAEAYCNRGAILTSLNRLEEAITSYDRAIALKSDYAEAYYNRGTLLGNLNRLYEALTSYDRAIALKSDFAEAYYNRGIILDKLKRFDEALTSYDRAIALKSDFAEAHFNRGIILQILNRQDEALTSYDRAIALKSDCDFLYGYWLNSKMMRCDWSNYDDRMTQLADKIEHNQNTSPPFAVLARLSSRALQKKAAEIYVRSKYPIDFALPKISKHPKHDKIRIGYFSADFRYHPLSLLMAELFEIHDRSKFELIALSFGPDTKDETRKRVVAAFDQFIDVRERTDQEVALIARNLEIDIAIDLGGFTAGCRTGIFAMRAAPIQVSYLGYLGSMGAEYIDYLIADATIIPQQHQQDYKEKIVYLPSYQVNDTKRIIADKIFTRKELGLPPTGFVFCCFNNSYKITPSIFDIWMRLLLQVEGSVLWLLGDNETAISNLRSEATLRGIDCNRLIFAKRLPLPEYLARYRIADLFLDTSPYNAGTTASDALWAGLPVLTCLGETFAGRVAASLLNAIHLPELISATQEEYETQAVLLATQPDKLMNIKQKLAYNRLTTPLFDTQQFTQHIEEAYIQMYERYQADLKPEHINTFEKSSSTT